MPYAALTIYQEIQRYRGGHCGAEMYLAQALECLAESRDMGQATYDLDRWVRDCRS